MAGTAVPPAPVAGMDNAAAASFINSFRISAVTDRLALHVIPTSKPDSVEFFNLCLSLARGIDYAVANNEVPSRARDLPSLLKQVCQCKNDSLLQAAIMVLMISVKNACSNGWFSSEESNELSKLAKEIGDSFCSARDINAEASTYLPTISTITLRFFPRMRMGDILTFLEVKPGYGAFAVDFRISKNAKSHLVDKIHLFVAQADNIETSSCVISPPQVNFLINGKGVERRTTVFMDTGPQLPTNVTHMLKYGTNLLQAVGQFNGNYIIMVAYMSAISTPELPLIQDYVQPSVAALESDSDIIEGPSRISLNCPISFRRIQTPVKGHSCKHLQCFDFDNYVDINSRRPSWRCPHCNRHVCYTDLRIDQNMVKVLKDVGKNIVEVIISADGSWKAVMESDADQSNDKTSSCKQNGHEQKESASLPNAFPDTLDLTEGDNVMDDVITCETEDRKPCPSILQSLSDIQNSQPLDTSNVSEINQNDGAHIEDDFWSGIHLPINESETSGGRPAAPSSSSVFETNSSNLMLSPVLTDAVSPAFDRGPETSGGNALTETALWQHQSAAANNLQLQQAEFDISLINEYVRFPTIARNVTRTPIAVQALPAPTLTSISQQRSRNSLTTMVHNGPSAASHSSRLPLISDAPVAASNNVEMQQQMSMSHINPLQMSHVTSSSLQQCSGAQIWDHQDNPPILGQSSQQVLGLPASDQLPSSYGSSLSLHTELQSLRRHPNLTMPIAMNQSPGLNRSSGHLSSQVPRTQVHQGVSLSGAGLATGVGNVPNNNRLMVAAQRANQIPRQSLAQTVSVQVSRATSSFPVNFDAIRESIGDQAGKTVGTALAVTRAESLIDVSAEQNWRPAGRMRGSLSGPAYSAALSQFIIPPTQPIQAARPPNTTSAVSSLPSPLQVLMANGRNAHATQAASEEAVITGAGSDILPQQSAGMH